MSVGRAYLVEAFLEFFGMENTESEPTKNLHEQNASLEAKNEHFDKVLEKFVDYHVFHLGVTVNDKGQNYGLSLIELFIVLMQLNDKIHEGDGDRNVINWKYLLWVFKANKKFSKYANGSSVLPNSSKVYADPPGVRTCDLGKRNQQEWENWSQINMQNDLEMEHTIKSIKNVITSKGPNKTEKAVLCSSIPCSHWSQ